MGWTSTGWGELEVEELEEPAPGSRARLCAGACCTNERKAPSPPVVLGLEALELHRQADRTQRDSVSLGALVSHPDAVKDHRKSPKLITEIPYPPATAARS